MPTLNCIREELKEIRYYVSRKEIFEKAECCVGHNAVEQRLEIYNKYICEAPARLYDLYVSLYLDNNTQESLSEKMGYSIEHICRLNTRLVKFFQDKMIADGIGEL